MTRVDPKMVQNHPKRTLFWCKKCQERPMKRPHKSAKNGQKWSRNQEGMFNNVEEHSESTYGTTRHIQLAYGSIVVKCRSEGDTSETNFRSLCKMALLAPRTGHKSSYSHPLDLVSSRIDSPKCPLQKKGFRLSVHFFGPQNDRFLA